MKIFNLETVIKGYLKSIAIDFSKGGFTEKMNEIEEVKQRRKAILSAHDVEIDTFERVWFSPSHITNAIINISKKNRLVDPNQIKAFYQFLENKICKHIVLIFEENLGVESIKKSLEKLADFNFHSVIIVCHFMDDYYSDEFGEIIMSIPMHKKLIVLNSPFEKNFEGTMFFTVKKESFGFQKSIGEFKVSFDLFDESQNHHTYFNRKLFIGANGEIKNAPECPEKLGLIQELNSYTDFEEIISSAEFQKYWFAHKQICSVCHLCEYRHVCVDNRLPLQRKDGTWYHAVECNYNPFIGKWGGDEGYLTLEECGVITTEQTFSIDCDRLNSISKNMFNH